MYAAPFIVLALAVGAGCRLEKEPLRAGWLASGAPAVACCRSDYMRPRSMPCQYIVGSPYALRAHML